MFKFLLIVALLLIQLSSASKKCSKAEMESIKSCESVIVGMSKKLNLTQAGVVPKAETLKELTLECKKTIDCVGDVKCAIFVENVVKPCQLMDLVAEVVPCFLNVSATISKSPEKYSCLKEMDIDVNSQNSLCKLLKNGKPCFERVTKEICGEKVKIDKIDQLVKPFLKCA